MVVTNLNMEYSQASLLPSGTHISDGDLELLKEAISKKASTVAVILSKLVANQRISLMHKYNAKFSTDMKKEIAKNYSSDLRDLLLLSLMSLNELDGDSLNDAIASKKADKIRSVFVDVILPKTNYELRQFATAYKTTYNKDLIDIIQNSIKPGFLYEVLMARMSKPRDQPTIEELHANSAGKIDKQLLESDIEMIKMFMKNIAVNNTRFAKLITTRSSRHLNLVVKNYKQAYGSSIYVDLKKAITRDDKKALGDSLYEELESSIKCLAHRHEYFAERIHGSMKGFGTEDNLLRRLILSRVEIDLEDIKEAYVSQYQKPMRQIIYDDTSGEYQKMFMYLVGG